MAAPQTGSPRTSSFFDTASTASPPPAPRWTPKPPPSLAPSPLSLSRASSRTRKLVATPRSDGARQQDEPLSPLHQSPSLSPIGRPEWQPPVPPTAEDLNLRFSPTATYLLGEGRYARVYLASYKRDRPESDRIPETSATSQGDGLVGGSWRLCAAKRMAPDRESQTMGLREAFFLNRLAPARGGSVYIVKLIAVKEDADKRAAAHSRSSSDAIASKPRMTRQRSSTLDDPMLATSPSLPALAQAVRTGPAVSRLVLLLEHAPLGTMDRLLRTSPSVVGKRLWERWAVQATEALAWVHEKGVVHADIKPGNLLLTRELDLRLSDFGSSLLVHPSHPPTDGVGLGTLPFSPPELVNPAMTFSFPIDVFALGATLYQCITGREPYRGCRPIELVHHVRMGDLWAWEERQRLNRVGAETTIGGSPYPSAWREQVNDGVRRGGSLRISSSNARPGLVRMLSAESLRASQDIADADDANPAGVRLWAKWVKRSSLHGPISALLNDESMPNTAEALSERQDEPLSSELSAPIHPPDETPAYADGSPTMIFLDGQDIVPDNIRDVLRMMVDADPAERPDAEEIKGRWASIGISLG